MLCPLARHFTPRKYWYMSGQSFFSWVLNIPKKRWLRPDMTEKLLTGTLCLNTNKQTNKQTNKTILPHAYYISGCEQWAAAVASKCFTTMLSKPLYNVAELSFYGTGRIDYGQLFFTLFFGKYPGDSRF